MDVAKWFFFATRIFALFGYCASLSNIQELHHIMDEYIAPRFTILQQRIEALENDRHEMEIMVEKLQYENKKLRQNVNLNKKEINFLRQLLNVEDDLINPNLDEKTQSSSANKSNDDQRENGSTQSKNNISTRNHKSYDSRILKRDDSTVPVSPRTIAFSAAYHADNVGPLRVNDIMKFDKLIINEGGRYDNLVGLFTCDEKGVYVFTWTVTAWSGHHVETKIVRNNNLEGLNDSFGSKQSSASNTVIVNLEVGDRVWIEVTEVVPADSKVYGLYTTFSGFLLK